MAELDVAATDALGKMKLLMEEFTEADTAFAKAEENIQKASTALEADWARVAEAGAEFLAAASAERTELDADNQQVLEALEAVKAQFGVLSGEATEAFEESTEQVEAFMESVRDLKPELEQLMSQVEERGKQLKERSEQLQEELQGTVEEMTEFLATELVNDIKTFKDEIEKRAKAVHDYIDDTCLPAINEKSDENLKKLEELRDGVKDHLEKLTETAQQSTTEALTKCFEDHTQTFRDLLEIVQQLQEILATLRDSIETGGTIIIEGKGTVDMSVKGTSLGLELAIGAIREILELFSRFSFIKM